CAHQDGECHKTQSARRRQMVRTVARSTLGGTDPVRFQNRGLLPGGSRRIRERSEKTNRGAERLVRCLLKPGERPKTRGKIDRELQDRSRALQKAEAAK